MKLTPTQHQCLWVLSYAGKLHRWPGGFWMVAKAYPHSTQGIPTFSYQPPTREMREASQCFTTNTVRSLERRDLIEPSHFEMKWLDIDEWKAGRCLTDTGRKLIDELGPPGE